jgi:tetratricopeptide (TPR) repeat protein
MMAGRDTVSWLDDLKRDPAAALDAVLGGRAALGSLSVAEPADALAVLLDRQPRDGAEWHAIDEACSLVLERFRDQIPQAEGPDFIVAVSRLDTLVAIIRRLLPPRTVIDLHRRFVLWRAFFDNFVFDRGLDLRREFFRILALTQEQAAAAGLEARRLMPFWLSVCGESGGTGLYDRSYLRVGLLGLRALPLGDDHAANERFALQGLAHWGAWRRPGADEFRQEWQVLEGDFPRDVKFWAEPVQEVLAATEREVWERTRADGATFPAAAWWRDALDLAPPPPRAAQGGRRFGDLAPVPEHDWKSIIRSLGRPLDTVGPSIQKLMHRQRRYAEATGDVFYLVRTACNVGMRLIENGAAAERRARGGRAVALAALAFTYDPVNVHAWSLMRDALAAAGRRADAERVGWEAIRRFPENEQWRTQLATLLAEECGKPAEAADLLRAAIRLFPGNSHARNQLATLLADDLGDRGAARQVLQAAIDDQTANEVTHTLLRKLDGGQRLRGQRRPVVDVGEDESRLTLPTAEARRLLFRLETKREGRDALEALLRQSGADAYLTYVAERVGLRDLPVKSGFALAFDAAVRRAEPSALRAIVARARPVERPLVEEAIALGEGRIVSLRWADLDSPGAHRFEHLGQALAPAGPPLQKDDALLLLRDFAASFLSADTGALLAA